MELLQKKLPDGYKLAIKEQRDLLFSKMKEAGYEWDAENRVLRKIEQKLADITDEWIEEYWQHEKVNNPYSYNKGDEIQFDYQGFVSFCKKYCQNHAWSEEDRIRITNCIHLIGKTGDGEVEWLKSLESRILPQIKPEWSEEDEVMLGNALWACKEKYCSTETYNWLKSLKERVEGK